MQRSLAHRARLRVNTDQGVVTAVTSETQIVARALFALTPYAILYKQPPLAELLLQQ
jgi:hypothetical protein